MGFRPMVKVYGEEKLCGNALVFETEQEVLDYGVDLISRWTLAEQVLVEPTEEPVNYVFKDGRLVFKYILDYCDVIIKEVTKSELDYDYPATKEVTK